MISTASSTDIAAEVLLRHWQQGTVLERLAPEIAPKNRTEAYQVGAALARQSGSAVIGWKIAATSTAGQKHINVDGPLGGRLLQNRMIQPGGSILLAQNRMRVAEVEFAFSFARALPPRSTLYQRDEVMAAVNHMHCSIEVPDSRYADFTAVGAAQLIADTGCACWLMIGPPVSAPWRDMDLAEHGVKAFIQDRLVAEGTGKAALGDPLEALVWLVNEVSRYAEGIHMGDIVTTGTCIVPAAIAVGDRITADYGVLGKLTAEIV